MSRTELHDNLTPTQVEILRSKSHHLLIQGPAGTGKTFIALAKAMTLLREKEVQQIVIIRSAVATRNIGFLPGDGGEKIEPFFAPYGELISRINPKARIPEMISKKTLRLESTSFLRGITFDNAFILVDEYQNLSGHELETVVGRVGEGTRLCLCGDSAQTDLKRDEAEEHHEVIQTLTMMDEVDTFVFGIEDIVRSEFLRNYFRAKERAQGVPVETWGKVA